MNLPSPTVSLDLESLGRSSSSWASLLRPTTLARLGVRSPAVFALVVAAVLHPRLARLEGQEAARAVSRWAARILRVGGVELLVLGSSPSPGHLVISNHRSYLDILAVLAARPASFLSKREVRSWPLVGDVASRMGVTFVDRRSRESRAEALKDVARSVLSGNHIVTFPEGTTTRGPGMGRTFPGLFRAAAAHQFGLQPMVIEYADREDAWVGDDTLIRHVLFWLAKPKTRIVVRLGSPLGLADAEDMQRDAEDWMHQALLELNASFGG